MSALPAAEAESNVAGARANTQAVHGDGPSQHVFGRATTVGYAQSQGKTPIGDGAMHDHRLSFLDRTCRLRLCLWPHRSARPQVSARVAAETSNIHRRRRPTRSTQAQEMAPVSRCHTHPVVESPALATILARNCSLQSQVCAGRVLDLHALALHGLNIYVCRGSDDSAEENGCAQASRRKARRYTLVSMAILTRH